MNTIKEIMAKVEEYGEAKYDQAALGWEGYNSTPKEDEGAREKCTLLLAEIRKMLSRR